MNKRLLLLLIFCALRNLHAIDAIKTGKPEHSAAYESALASAPWQTAERLKKELNVVDADPAVEKIVAQGVKDLDIKEKVFVFKSIDEKHNEKQSYACARSCEGFHVITYCPWVRTVTHHAPKPKPRFLFNTDLLESQPAEYPASIMHTVKEYMQPQAYKVTLYHELSHIKNREQEAENHQNAFNGRRTAFAMGQFGLAAAILAAPSASSGNLLGLAGSILLPLAFMPRHAQSWENEASRLNESQADALAVQTLIKKKEYRAIIHDLLEYNFIRNYRYEETPGYGTHPTFYEREQAAWKALKASGIIWTQELYEQIVQDLQNDQFKAEKIKALQSIHVYCMRNQHGRDCLLAEEQTENNKKRLAHRVLHGKLRAAIFANAYWRKDNSL